ncbi:hypothetical protein DSO57_1007905 [Entomophthora muscae]|uniref:Uncharacterized protein n=1 Tax=Entomophthora muscae TaxID=34485 RepID=A0ACC2T711_9FUNG|nr:hypothetical protein DSO57_1007905 [Entomophthora muscae]
MHVVESQLWNSNPKTLQAASLQAQLPCCPRFLGLKPEPNLNLEKLLRPTSLELHAPITHLQKDPVSPAKESSGLINNPEITGATSVKELKKLPVECGPPKDDKSSLSLTPLNPKKLRTNHPNYIVHQELPLAQTRETKTVFREGHKITISPLLFRNKYNYLPTYLVPMTPPLTLWPNHPQEYVATNESTSTQIFGMVYIPFTGLIGSMVPASGPWALLGRSLSYIVKLAPILWWPLPSGPAGCLPASSQESPSGWISDTACHLKGISRTNPPSWGTGLRDSPDWLLLIFHPCARGLGGCNGFWGCI